MTTASIPSVASSRIPLSYVVAIVPVAAALNVVGGTINTALNLPTFLDMIGTAVAAIVLGPWWGALVGVMGNVAGAFFTGPVGIPFALANVAGALVWGYGVRSLGMGATVTRFFILNILVALATSPGRVWTRDMLLTRIWGDSAYRDPRTIDVHIRHLREKLERDAKDPEYLFTVRGVGYRFRDTEG